MEIDYKHEVRNFLDKDGRLKCFPSKHKYKILALYYLSKKFSRGKFYSENEVNEIIDSSHIFGDRCLLRRELVNKKFIGRTTNCSQYWMEDNQPEIQELIENL